MLGSKEWFFDMLWACLFSPFVLFCHNMLCNMCFLVNNDIIIHAAQRTYWSFNPWPRCGTTSHHALVFGQSIADHTFLLVCKKKQRIVITIHLHGSLVYTDIYIIHIVAISMNIYDPYWSTVPRLGICHCLRLASCCPVGVRRWDRPKSESGSLKHDETYKFLTGRYRCR